MRTDEPEHSGEATPCRRPPRRPRSGWRTLGRVLGIAALAALALPLVYMGPLVFIPVIGGGMLIQRLLRRRQDRVNAERARRCRAAALERALEAGGPSDEPARHREKRSIAEIQKDIAGPKHTSYIGGFWPRGRV